MNVRRELGRVRWRGVPYRVTYSRKSADEFMGRFGGGWQWKIGIMAGPSTVILDLFVASLAFRRVRS